MKLEKGDKIALVAPSGFIEKENLTSALKWFERIGLIPVVMPHVYDKFYYMAGQDMVRAEDVNKAFVSEAKAVFCVRGGAGALKMLSFLDYDLIKKNPKPVFGLSDSTALQNALYAKANIESYTGFLPIFDFKTGVLDEKIEQSLTDIFKGKPLCYQGGKCLIEGSAQGELIGGCLSVFCSLCGTPYFPNLEGKILLIEDIAEKTYRLDLMLEQLFLQPSFSKIKGLIFGRFLNCEPADIEDGEVSEIVTNFARKANVPTLIDFDYGHIKSRFVMPLGQTVLLNTKECVVKTIKK